MTDTGLKKLLDGYSDFAKTRFHMPGHGGVPFGGSFDGLLKYDVTELKYTDDLHSPRPDGAFEAMYRDCKSIYPHAADVFFSCSGSTAMLKAAIITTLRGIGCNDDTYVACDRSVHYSVLGALAYNKVNILWYDGGASMLADIVKRTHVSLIITTSPNYYGTLRDIQAIASTARETGAKLIVDAAHGAHLDYYDGGSLSASAYLNNGVTALVQSLHKTLPALTGAALLQTDSTFTRGEYEAVIKRCESSSPSFLIALSIAECLRYMEKRGAALLDELLENIRKAEIKLRSLGWDVLKDGERDPFRMCITPPDSDIERAYSHLSKQGVICEFFDSEYIILIPSVNHTREAFTALTNACAAYIPDAANKIKLTKKPTRYPKTATTLFYAYRSKSLTLPLTQAEGCICAEPLYSYPPGISLIVPGEVFDGETIELLTARGIFKAEVLADEQREPVNADKQ